MKLMLYRQILEYTGCIPYREVWLPPPKIGVLGMTLSCISWWDSSFGALYNVEYSFIAIIPWAPLGHIYGLNRTICKSFFI